jgi:predicted MFS family arabinose efflux permease
MAGGLLGQVLGVGIGGAVAAAHGWRSAFLAIGLGGLVLGMLYLIVVKEHRLTIMSLAANDPPPASSESFPKLGRLFEGRAIKCAYIGSGLQLLVAGALPAWLPTYVTRYYDLPLAQAASLAAMFIAICGIGMVVCGVISDRLFRAAEQRILLAAVYCACCAALLTASLTLPPGTAQLVLLGFAIFFAAGVAGPAGAMVANLTPAPIHGTAFATLTLANNLLGLAPGPIVTGWLADRIGLLDALRWLPLASLAAALVFLLARQPKSARAAVAAS